MAAVPQKTLSWLYDVLKRQYHDPNRTYSDLANTLARHPGFAPRTDVYTFETGAPALLLVFKGTIPVNFRGNTYRFPISFWVPHAYPYDAPMCYVTPTEDMMIRPGQHVGGDGRIYHPYLAHWRDHWERSNILDFLSILSDIFAKEPPVMSRTAPPPQRQAQPTPPAVPPLPREMQLPQQNTPVTGPPSAQQVPSPGPPPPPPKQPSQGGVSVPQHSTSPGSNQSPLKPGRYDAPPPLPPQAQGQHQRPPQSFGNGDVQRPPGGMNYMPQRSSSLRHSMPPHPPPQQQQQQQPQQPPFDSQQYRPQPYRPGEGPQYNPPPQNMQPPNVMSPPPAQAQEYKPQPQQYRSAPPQGYPERPVSQYYPPQQPPPQQPHPPYNQQQQPQHPHPQLQAPRSTPPVPQPNLLDSPFDIPLPAAPSSTTHLGSNIPAPPIPLNPEKEALLTHLSHLLTTSLHTQISQQSSALQPLSSQTAALHQAQHNLSQELSHLTTLKSTLSSNITLLQSSLSSADAAISSAHARAQRNDIPAVDDMLTAPTVVGRQLYDVVCEERGIEAAMLALQDAFVKGRVGGDVWARKTRELAREGFKRRWMERKIALGMGLDLGAGGYRA